MEGKKQKLLSIDKTTASLSRSISSHFLGEEKNSVQNLLINSSCASNIKSPHKNCVKIYFPFLYHKPWLWMDGNSQKFCIILATQMVVC